ncbi:MAG: ABC transporter permease [Acidimicrobiia bacterium]
MWKVTIKGILAHKIRFLLTGVAVILGVAFISGTLVLTATINKTFSNLLSNVYEHTDAVVRAKAVFKGDFGSVRGRIDASLIPEVRKTQGVAEAVGNITGFAQIVDKDGTALNNGNGPPALGFAWTNSPDLSPFHLVQGKGPVAPDQIVMDKHTADKAGFKIGSTVSVITQKGAAKYRLVGIAEFGNANGLLGATTVMFTPPVASAVLGQPGKVDEIDVRADSGVSQEQLAKNIKATLNGRKTIEVLTGKQITKESQNDISDQLGFFNTFLLIFGVIALLVGSFIIFNTFSIIVAQRSREMALLRAIGARGGQVIRSVLFEAALVGLVASIVGFFGGVVLAILLKAVLAALGIDIPASAITIPTTAVVWSFIVGMLVTIVAAVFPAIRASRIPPIAALARVGADQSAGSWKRVLSGLVVTAIGIALLVSGISSSSLPPVGFGAFVVFMGVAVLGPTIARPISAVLGWPIRRIKGITGLLAEENAKRNPKRTSATAAALMIGVALVCLIIVFGASARASVQAGIDQSMKADYIVTSGGFGLPTLPRVLEEKLQATKGVSQVSGTQFGPIKVGDSVQNTMGVDPKVVDSLFDLEVSQGSLQALQLDGIAVQRPTAEDNKWKVGDEVRVQFPTGGPKLFTVQAIFDQTKVPQVPNFVISTAAFTANYPNVLDQQIYIRTHGGPSPAHRAAIKQTLKPFPNGKLQDRDQFKAAQAAQINQLLNLIYALLLFAIFIALFGIANTLGLSIIERTRELGLMRAVGMTRRQVRSLVRWEAVIIALLGAFLGIVVGVAFGWVMVTALKSEGISQFRAGPMQLVFVFVVAALFGVLAAIWPARSASKLDVLNSISTE